MGRVHGGCGSSCSPVPWRDRDRHRLYPCKSCHLAQSPRLRCLLCDRSVIHLLRGFRVRAPQERHGDDYTQDFLSASVHLFEGPCSCSNGLGWHRSGLNRYHWGAHPRGWKGGREEKGRKEGREGKRGQGSEKASKQKGKLKEACFSTCAELGVFSDLSLGHVCTIFACVYAELAHTMIA